MNDNQLYELAARVGHTLKAKGMMMATAESCTGGGVENPGQKTYCKAEICGYHPLFPHFPHAWPRTGVIAGCQPQQRLEMNT